MHIAKLLRLLVLLLLSVPVARAQEFHPGPDTVRVVLTDGSSHLGVLKAETDTTYTFQTLAGIEMQIPRGSVRRFEAVDGLFRGGKFLRPDPNATRLLFAPTARPLGHGRGYVADYQILFPFVAVGVGPNVSLAGGVSIVPFSPWQMAYVAPKVTLLDRDRISVAIGVLAGTVIGEESGSGFGGIGYGLVTYGSRLTSVTIGGGPTFSSGGDPNTVLLVIAGETQLSNNIKLITENYVVPSEENGYLLSGGVRFFGERLATDFGFITNLSLFDEGGWPLAPWLGFAYNWGR